MSTEEFILNYYKKKYDRFYEVVAQTDSEGCMDFNGNA